MPTSLKRRRLLKGSLAAGLHCAILGSGLIRPGTAMAAWPKAAFDARTVAEALLALFGQELPAETSPRVNIKAPTVADDRNSVRVEVATDLPAADLIAILVPDNPFPLAASFELTPAVRGQIVTRVRMRQSGDVIALVRAEGLYYHARQAITVNLGETAG